MQELYENSAERQAARQLFIDGYNRFRLHPALNHQPALLHKSAIGQSIPNPK